MPQTLDLSSYRDYFPSLASTVHGQPAIFFDNPGGTQVPRQVIDGMVTYLQTANANTDGAFLTSRRTNEIISAARQGMADLLHASSSQEIVVTVLDHDANVVRIDLADAGVTLTGGQSLEIWW